MPSLPETRLIHEELLVLLEKFDEYCIRHDVKYALLGGTLLGAVREGGFIPWDDDADLAITRAEYEKLRDALHACPMGDEFFFGEFSAQHPRIWMRRKDRPGVWLDLFIYDFISENKIARKLKLLGCCCFLAFTKTKESMEVSRKADLHHGLRLALLNIGYTLGRPFTPRFKARLANAFGKYAFRGRGTRIHRSNDAFSYIGLSLPAGVMAGYRRIPFEHLNLMIMERWHEVLVSDYGPDYMTPKRYASHDNPAHDGFRGEA